MIMIIWYTTGAYLLLKGVCYYLDAMDYGYKNISMMYKIYVK